MQCELCDYQTKWRNSFIAHMKAHQTPNQSRYPCPECGKEFTQSSAMHLHYRSKHEGIKYPCNQCDYQASYRSDLNRHLRTKHIAD